MERNPYPQLILEGQGPSVLAVGAGGDCLAFSLHPPSFFLPLSGKRFERD